MVARVLTVVGVVALLVGGPQGAALAAPTRMCAVGDERLAEISGIVTTTTGYIAINDGGDELRTYVLDRTCKVTRVRSDSSVDPFDPEDLARSRDGTLWIADIGDNDRERTSIAVHQLAPGATRAQLLRMTYPDGPHDAEALVMQPNGLAVVVTKEALGAAGVYRTRAVPRAGQTMAMTKVGSLTIEPTGTEGGPPGLGGVAQRVVTGAALSLDGKRMVVRTYTDAYEWDVSADVAGSIVKGTPRRTPLPGEQQGESITYSMDGATFVTVSEGSTSAIQRWAPIRPTTATSPPVTASRGIGAAGDGAEAGGVSLRQLVLLVVAIGIVGLLLVVAGVFGIVRFRREREREALRSWRNRLDDGRPRDGAPESEADPDDPSTGGTATGGASAGRASAGRASAGRTPSGHLPVGGATTGRSPAGGTPAGRSPAGGTPAGRSPAGPRRGASRGVASVRSAPNDYARSPQSEAPVGVPPVVDDGTARDGLGSPKPPVEGQRSARTVLPARSRRDRAPRDTPDRPPTPRDG